MSTGANSACLILFEAGAKHTSSQAFIFLCRVCAVCTQSRNEVFFTSAFAFSPVQSAHCSRSPFPPCYIRKTVRPFAVGADVTSNYLMLAARQLIQTVPRLEKREKMKHRKNERGEEGNRREEREGRGEWERERKKEGEGEGENSFPELAPECLEAQCKC